MCGAHEAVQTQKGAPGCLQTCLSTPVISGFKPVGGGRAWCVYIRASLQLEERLHVNKSIGETRSYQESVSREDSPRGKFWAVVSAAVILFVTYHLLHDSAYYSHSGWDRYRLRIFSNLNILLRYITTCCNRHLIRKER